MVNHHGSPLVPAAWTTPAGRNSSIAMTKGTNAFASDAAAPHPAQDIQFKVF
jgi:hypothetical protein